MKVLGIDSATVTGWGIIERPRGQTDQLVDRGIIKPRDPDVIDNFVTDVFDRHPDLDAVSIERPFMLKNPNTTIMLSMLVGEFRFAFSRRVPVTVTPPAEWRKVVLTGMLPKGRLKRTDYKTAAIAWVLLKFGIEVTEDEAEAICIAYYGLRQRLFAGQ